jgi:hypothetical protein
LGNFHCDAALIGFGSSLRDDRTPMDNANRASYRFQYEILKNDNDDRNTIMYADEIWVAINLYGPQSEIDRLREICAIIDIDGSTDDPVVDFRALMRGSMFGEQYWTWNLVSRGPHEPCTLDFGFDAYARCPEEIFECLAAEFPTLAFHCRCIASMDEFMAEGWYNGPVGSPNFDYRSVPDDYWETCGTSARDDKAVADHQTIVKNLIDVARAQQR